MGMNKQRAFLQELLDDHYDQQAEQQDQREEEQRRAGSFDAMLSQAGKHPAPAAHARDKHVNRKPAERPAEHRLNRFVI